MNTDCETVEINNMLSNKEIIVVKKTKIKEIKENQITLLNKYYNKDNKVFEIGVDESGRGPLFGRVYTAAVILPKDDSFDFSKLKDSKKFHSKKKIIEVAEYIKTHALSWHVSYEDEKKIDEINILQATQLSMHNSIFEVIKKSDNILIKQKNEENIDYSYSLLIDGNYFNSYNILNKVTNQIENVPHKTIVSGDNKYASIAAASILAKVTRDNYIIELCNQHPTLIDFYNIDSNKGYGAKKHMDGIKEHGITMWHRKSFAPCKNYI